MGTTIHAWLKLVIDRMPEPLVNMGTEKTAADRVIERVVPPIAPDIWYRLTGHGHDPMIHTSRNGIGQAAEPQSI